MTKAEKSKGQVAHEGLINQYHKIYAKRYKAMSLGSYFMIYDYKEFDLVKKDGKYLLFEKEHDALVEATRLTGLWLPILEKQMADRKKLWGKDA